MTTKPSLTPDEAKAETIAEIEAILHEHSGGLKMTALVVELLPRMWKANGKITPPNADADDLIEELVKEMPNVHILEYDWDMENKQGKGHIRAKQFVYTNYE
tara:strand:+ start:133631 stop:133936 length:306 start_codon:yes stop_codon:yes gene_type:complete